MHLGVRTFANGVQLKLESTDNQATYHAWQGDGFCTDHLRGKTQDPFQIAPPLYVNQWSGVLQHINFTQPVCVTIYHHIVLPPDGYYSAIAAVDTKVLMPMRHCIYDDHLYG